MSQKNEVRSQEVLSLGQRFLERIGRQDLESRLTPLTPYGYVCPEYLLDRISPNGVAYSYHGRNGISNNGFGPDFNSAVSNGFSLDTQFAASFVSGAPHPDYMLIHGDNGGHAGDTADIDWSAPGTLAGAGGLGALGADTVLDAAGTGIHFDATGIFHTRRMHQVIGTVGDLNNRQMDIFEPSKTPEQLGLKKVEGLSISVATNGDVTHLDVYDLHIGGLDSQTNIHLLYEPNLREVYPGRQEEDHRLYQMTVLGFGSAQIWQQLGKDPAVLHLNESSTSLAALGMWDNYMQKHLDIGMDADEAFVLSLQEIRAKTILTNHTLVPAAEATYSKYQYENYILKNIKNEKIKQRVLDLMGDRGGMAILDLGMYLAGKFNGVSKLHGELATKGFQAAYGDGSPIRDGREPFVIEGVTNAINRRWNERISAFYQREGIVDEFDLPTDMYKESIDALDPAVLRAEKEQSAAELRHFLRERKLGNNEIDGQGHAKVLDLPDNAKVIGWARRFAGYKRPGMLLDDLDQLKLLLKKHPDAHVVYAGKTHQTDDPMKDEMRRILHLIEYTPELSGRIHFLQDYDINAGRKLTSGAHIWLNNPIVGKEACGTSIFKAVKSNAILVSTPDGGAADAPNDTYMAVEEMDVPNPSDPENRPKHLSEHDALYWQLDQALTLANASADEWGAYIKKQLKAFMPIIAGGRMIKDYLNFALPQEMPVAA